ncbi:MAG: 3-dehydroquinate synthase [Desulfovermiculus sp.]|nr:3-dehydroquinate synthase [Desulfovermiculus sp.]
MHETIVQTKGQTSRILIGRHDDKLTTLIPNQRAAIVTDHNVYRLYGSGFPELPVLTIGSGEGIKNLETVAQLARELMDLNADRSWFILGIGGGIVCDVAGFLASIYMRGVRFGFVPTTLLAQVDASVGGKNGVNLDGYKNMLGVFNQPEFVLCDPEYISTLKEEDLACGLAEVIKHAAIADLDLFSFLEVNQQAVLGREQQAVQRLVLDSVRIKANVVSQDEKESGLRRVLNFGHTFGHALEKETGISHGRAVSQGMAAAAELSVRRGLLSQADCARLRSLLTAYHLPTQLQTEPANLVQALARDKKREGDDVHFVLLQGLGQAVVQTLPLSEVEEVLQSMQ